MKSTIIDVRMPKEYSLGHLKDSINIPMGEIPNRIEEIKSLAEPRILVCASGNRSGQVTRFLNQSGVICENGGSWMDVNMKDYV